MKQSGVFTQMRGKLGGMIYQVLKGEQIGKTFAIPTNPQTSTQQANRGVFGQIIDSFKSIAIKVASLFWEPFAVGNKTGWGNFIGANLIAMGSTAFDMTKAIMSKGSLEGIATLAAVYDTADGSIDIDWVGTTYNNGDIADHTQIVVAESNDNTILGVFANEDTRGDELAQVSVVAGLTATDIEVFVWFSQEEADDAGDGLISNSQHCTCTAPV